MHLTYPIETGKCAGAELDGSAGAPEFPPMRIATLPVREYTEGEKVELWLGKSGRPVIRAFNECGNNYTDTDLFDLLEWARTGVAF